MSDLRDAFRALRSTPIVTAVAILSLALGIGANTAIFSLINALMLRSLPVKEPQRLVQLLAGTGPSWTNPLWEQIRERDRQIFDGAFAYSTPRFNLAAGGETQFVNGVMASGEYFDVLGVRAIVGRTFGPADDVRGGGPDGPVAVISSNFWQRHFGGALDVIGKPIMICRRFFLIAAILSVWFGDTPAGAVASNQLPNGSFEEASSDPNTPNGWMRQAFAPGASLTWEIDTTHDGLRSARIGNPTPNDAAWTQTVALEPDRNYLLSGWIKTENVAHAHIRSKYRRRSQSVTADEYAAYSVLKKWP